MRVNIYDNERLIEQNKFFKSIIKAKTYCMFVCPSKYGRGNYYPVILK